MHKQRGFQKKSQSLNRITVFVKHDRKKQQGYKLSINEGDAKQTGISKHYKGPIKQNIRINAELYNVPR